MTNIFQEKLKKENDFYELLQHDANRLLTQMEKNVAIKSCITKTRVGCQLTSEDFDMTLKFATDYRKTILSLTEGATQAILRLDALEPHHVIERRERKNTIVKFQTLIETVEVVDKWLELMQSRKINRE